VGNEKRWREGAEVEQGRKRIERKIGLHGIKYRE
jgi:hypothetical protein